MSEQDRIAFEKWYAETWNITVEQMHKKPNGDYIYKPTQGAYEAWQAAKTHFEETWLIDNEKKILALESEVAAFEAISFVQIKQIDELQASNNDLREALEHADEFIRNGIEFGYIRMPDESLKGIDSAHDTPEIIRKALSTTPAESLQAHDDELIEKCAKVCEENFKPFTYDGVAEAIRALKEVK